MKKFFQFAMMAAVACAFAACSGNGAGGSVETETISHDYASLRLSVDVPKDKGYKIVESDSLPAEWKEWDSDSYYLYLVTEKAVFFFGEGFCSFDKFADWKAFCKEKFDAQTGYYNTYEELQVAGREAVKFDKYEEQAYTYMLNTDDFAEKQTIGELKVVATQGTIDEALADPEVKAIFESIKYSVRPEE
jgi:hypothetical protein